MCIKVPYKTGGRAGKQLFIHQSGICSLWGGCVKISSKRASSYKRPQGKGEASVETGRCLQGQRQSLQKGRSAYAGNAVSFLQMGGSVQEKPPKKAGYVHKDMGETL